MHGPVPSPGKGDDMKAIINGFRYDTDKAIKIGSASHGEFVTDFSYWSASLYVTKRASRYFLAGEGGAMTLFASSRGSGSEYRSGYGSRVIEMTRAEALAWAEQYLDADEIDAGFSDAIQDA